MSHPAAKGASKTVFRGKSHVTPPEINAPLLTDELQTELAAAWQSQETLEKETILLQQDPFKVCIAPKFIAPDSFLRQLQEELLGEIFYQKNNDLYQFHQTDDFRKLKAPYACSFRKFMQKNVLPWMQRVTGIELTHKIDITCSRYDQSDVLLCHDDELDTRRIAFILYLTPQWFQDDGGLLDLFDMDDHLQARDIVRSIVPQWNSLLFFEVTEASHHQVSEVIGDKTRLSVNGWFHAPPLPRPARYVEPSPTMTSWRHIEKNDFLLWINPMYLDSEVQKQIQSKFEKASEIELPTFIHEDRYEELVKALRSSDLEWTLRGPANKRHYHCLNLESAPKIIKDCMLFLQSEAFFLVLGQLTGLSLHPLVEQDDDDNEEERTSVETVVPADESSSEDSREEAQAAEVPSSKKPKLDLPSTSGSGNSRCHGEVRRWEHGCYTLVHDTDSGSNSYALDASFFCSCAGWMSDFGGYIAYISKNEDEELLTVLPRENSMALVYRDTETLGFVKYVNSSVLNKENGMSKKYYGFSLTYYE